MAAPPVFHSKSELVSKASGVETLCAERSRRGCRARAAWHEAGHSFSSKLVSPRLLGLIYKQLVWDQR